MCGITGIVNLDGKDVSPKILKKINDKIYRRGPDDEGFYIHKNVGLASRRLSIIDLSTGHQPIGNEDNSIWITFNGEIYNYPELRSFLIDQGHKFSTKTDTEAIVHLYEESGNSFLSKLNGMFAFAIYDIKKQKLILARDRMGEKPLYYGKINDQFFFASELKAIMSLPEFKRKIDLESLSQYLSFEYVPSPRSIFKNVFKLPPSSYLALDLKTGIIKVSNYWEINFNNLKGLTFSEYLFELDRRLYETVKSRMITDVPLGVFLSGGIDSSTITYYMTKISPGKVKSFSIGFSDPSFDESKYARTVAKCLGTDHREKILDPKKAFDLIPNITTILDEPMADASIIPTYLLSDFTRRYVKVALGGDGGDELFMGYPTYQAHLLAKYFERVPKEARNFFRTITCAFPVSFNNFSFDFKIKRFIDRFETDPILRDAQWLGSFTEEEKENLLLKKFNLNGKVLKNYLNSKTRKSLGYFEKIIFSYLVGYLPEDILFKTDRASMYASFSCSDQKLLYRL